MRVATVIGNRPQFVKAAAVFRPLRERAQEVVIHTGQHHDDALSRVFFDELELPRPDHELGIDSGSNTSQTARMLTALAPLLAQLDPDVVLVYGDTNSTLAGALAAAQAGFAVAHVEAGMRSFDRRMPEELNRVLCDHVSELLLCSSQAAVDNLEREGAHGRVELVGDVMVDVGQLIQPRARERDDVLERHGVAPGEYLLLTAHRPGNVDTPGRARLLLDLVAAIEQPVVLPLHPRTAAALERAALLDELHALAHLRVCEPLGYLEFTALLCRARAVLTDSGGVQKEAYLAGVPCVTLRDTTEWTETVDAGWNVLVDLDRDAALAALAAAPPSERPPLYGDGHAGERVAAAVAAAGAGAVRRLPA